ncbi:acyl carrier protein [Catellatospora methionotrophica]|uniref:acyl carrier protein n=1 Tax=Catellatospora methionotrophica TaxID=121620 RepID=UPI0033F616C5
MSASTFGAYGATTTETTILAFIEDHTKISWEPDTDLFASGSVTSLFALELVVFLERTFGVAVTGEDLTLANFRTVAAMTALVDRLRERT